MENVCDHCAKPVQSDGDIVTCMGFCNQTAHAKCAKMNSAFLKVLHERKNLFWMCDECVKLMKMARFKGALSSISCAVSEIASSHGEVISELKQAILVNAQQMELLSKQVTETVTTPLTSRFVTGEPPKKRRREERTKANKPLLIGTNSSTSQAVTTVPPPKELFWLYLSRIHPSVKSEAVVELVKNSLQCEDPVKVFPLLKKDADLNTMNFISFKVGLDTKYRDIALSTSTWPRSLLFREFDDTSSKNYWVPSRNPTLQAIPRIEVTPTSDCQSPNSNQDSSQMEP